MLVCFSGRNNSKYKHLMKIYLSELTQKLEIEMYLSKKKKKKGSTAKALEIKPPS